MEDRRPWDAQGHELRNLAGHYRDKGENDKASRIYTSLVSSAKKGKGRMLEKQDTGLLSDLLLDLGTTYCQAGDFNAGVRTLKESVSVTKKAHGADFPGLAVPMHNLGECYRQGGKLMAADKHFSKALSLAAKKRTYNGPKDYGGQSKTYQAQALVFQRQQRYQDRDEALQLGCRNDEMVKPVYQFPDTSQSGLLRAGNASSERTKGAMYLAAQENYDSKCTPLLREKAPQLTDTIFRQSLPRQVLHDEMMQRRHQKHSQKHLAKPLNPLPKVSAGRAASNVGALMTVAQCRGMAGYVALLNEYTHVPEIVVKTVTAIKYLITDEDAKRVMEAKAAKMKKKKKGRPKKSIKKGKKGKKGGGKKGGKGDVEGKDGDDEDHSDTEGKEGGEHTGSAEDEDEEAEGGAEGEGEEGEEEAGKQDAKGAGKSKKARASSGPDMRRLARETGAIGAIQTAASKQMHHAGGDTVAVCCNSLFAIVSKDFEARKEMRRAQGVQMMAGILKTHHSHAGCCEGALITIGALLVAVRTRATKNERGGVDRTLVYYPDRASQRVAHKALLCNTVVAVLCEHGVGTPRVAVPKAALATLARLVHRHTRNQQTSNMRRPDEQPIQGQTNEEGSAGESKKSSTRSRTANLRALDVVAMVMKQHIRDTNVAVRCANCALRLLNGEGETDDETVERLAQEALENYIEEEEEDDEESNAIAMATRPMDMAAAFEDVGGMELLLEALDRYKDSVNAALLLLKPMQLLMVMAEEKDVEIRRSEEEKSGISAASSASATPSRPASAGASAAPSASALSAIATKRAPPGPTLEKSIKRIEKGYPAPTSVDAKARSAGVRVVLEAAWLYRQKSSNLMGASMEAVEVCELCEKLLLFFDEQLLEDGKEMLYQTKGYYVETWSDEEEEAVAPTKTSKGKGKGKKGKGKAANTKKVVGLSQKAAPKPPKTA
jgi:hypothetical protein